MKLHLRDFLIAWSLLPFLTPARKRLLLRVVDPLDRIDSLSEAELGGVLSISPAEARIVKEPLTLPAVARDLEHLSAEAIALVDTAYPPLLREIHDPPLALFVRGRRELLDGRSIAIVGSRRASPYGLGASRRFARELAGRGITVVSGLARGIDAAAHEEALLRDGPTVAVLGTGIDVAYPPEHARLRDRIASEGLLVTELPPGTPPRREHFPVRNRIIAGLTLGTVVVEAGERSGSLITARLASEQGREVFAVPGSIFSAGSTGGHRLIQDGAKLIHTIDDLLGEIAALRHLQGGKGGNGDPIELEPALARVFEIIPPDDAIDVDTAAERSGLAAGPLAEALLRLELLGLVRAFPGARYMRGSP